MKKEDAIVNEDVITKFCSKMFAYVPNQNRKIYFLGTPEELEKFTNGIEKIHNEEKLNKQNEYLKTKWNN